jgi:hypothetical protein
MGLTATTTAAVSINASLMPGTARIGPTDVMGLDGHTITASAARMASTTPGGGASRIRARVAHLAHVHLGSIADEILLKVEPAIGPEDARPHRLIRHRQHGGLHAEPVRDRAGHLGQHPSLAEEARSVQMRGQIAIAEIEPRRFAKARHPTKGVKRLVGQPPAACEVDHAGERVADRVEVGRNVEPPDLRVVARVDDDGQIARVEELGEPPHQLRGARAAREGHGVHGGAPVYRVAIGRERAPRPLALQSAVPPRQP